MYPLRTRPLYARLCFPCIYFEISTVFWNFSEKYYCTTVWASLRQGLVASCPPCVRVSTVESHEEEATLCVSRTCCFHQLVSYVFWTAIVTMAPPSKKKKALREANIKKALKRWRKDGQPESATITTHLTAAGPSSSAQALLSSPHGSHLSSAEYRHSLLPQEVRETHEVSDDGVVILISVARLKALTNLVRCDCGNKVTSNVSCDYFDCTVDLKCDECKQTVYHSKPRKCKNSDLTEGNVLHVKPSLLASRG